MAGERSDTVEAEVLLQEFIDALQTLILFLPSVERRPDSMPDECLAAAGAAARRTSAAARQLRQRLGELGRSRRGGEAPIVPRL